MGKGTSIRLDDKTEWALELIKRRTGRTWTSIIEAGAMREVEHALSPEKHDTHEPMVPERFDKLWHPDEGVRHIRLLFSGVYPLRHEEDEQRVLVSEHKEVWFDEEGDVIVDNARALHPHLQALIGLRRETSSRKAVAKAIAGYLGEAAKRGQV